MSQKGAAIVVIGDEILSGKFQDENAVYLIGELRSLGTRLSRIEIITDDIDDIADAVGRCKDHDHVFTSGGVGPTHDDVTMAGIAQAFSVAVTRHPEFEALLRDFYGDRVTDAHLRMAEVPDGAELVDGGGDQRFPIVKFSNVYILPGVPKIFRRKFDAIRERFRNSPFVVRRAYCDIDEGALAGPLGQVVAQHPDVALGSYPRFWEKDYKVLVTLESKDETAVLSALDALIKALPAKALVRTE